DHDASLEEATLSEWPPDPPAGAQYRYPTYGLAVQLAQKLGSAGQRYLFDRSLDAPFDPQISPSLDPRQILRGRGEASIGPWRGVRPSLSTPRAVWNLIAREAKGALSTKAVENLVLELESRHPKISRTELLALSYVPTDLLSLLTRRNENIHASR